MNQTVVEMERGFLFIMSVSDGSSLAVLRAHPGCDIGSSATRWRSSWTGRAVLTRISARSCRQPLALRRVTAGNPGDSHSLTHQ